MRLIAFPAQLSIESPTGPAGEFRPVKVYENNDTLHAFAAVNGQVVEVAALPLALPLSATGRAWTAMGVDGTVWTVTKTGGCGCSSPLKRWSPPQPQRIGT